MELGVLMQKGGGSPYSTGPEFVPFGVGRDDAKRIVSEAFVQIIKDNFPITIEQTASGLYEVLFLLTTIIGENGKILLLDEPELHLHPTMQKRVLSLLSESITQNANQILLITHSPYLISRSDVDVIWRFTVTENGTKVHNLGRVLSNLESQEQEKLRGKLSNPDVRSLLFSRGVIFVEGPSDKIVVEQVDRHLSAKGKGAYIEEREWPVIDIGGIQSLPSFMILSRMLDIPYLAVLDYDALMRRDKTIKINSQSVKTSTIIYALKCIGEQVDRISFKDLLSEAPRNEWYQDDHFKDLRAFAQEYGIFVFTKDLEGVMQTQPATRMRKALKALERILELIAEDTIPSEFFELEDFLSRYTLPQDKLELKG
jgi:predicted ATP-dependent endonuclease of OLD family